MKIQLYNPQSDSLQRPKLTLQLRRSDGVVTTDVRVVGATGGYPLIEVTGVESPEQSEFWRDAELSVPKEDLKTSPDQYFYADLIGCDVKEGEQSWGTVTAVFEAGASDVLVVSAGKQEQLIPMVPPWVVKVDLANRTIWVYDAAQFEPQ